MKKLKDLISFIHTTDGDKNIYVSTKTTSIVYAYCGNTIAYFDTNIILDLPDCYIKLSEIENIESIEELEKYPFVEDDQSIDFNFEHTNTKEISKERLVKLFSNFSKFYSEDDHRPELSGVHLKNGKIFASDSKIMKYNKNDLIGNDCNMIININPIVKFFGIDPRKIKKVSRSLFAKPTKDIITVSHIKGEEGGLHITSDKLDFLVTSLGESKLNMETITTFKPTHRFQFQRESLISTIRKTLDNQPIDADSVRDYIKLNFDSKVEISYYVYPGFEDNEIKTLNLSYKNLENTKISCTLNGEYLLTLLKQLKEDVCELQFNDSKSLVKITSKKTNSILLLAGTIYE